MSSSGLGRTSWLTVQMAASVRRFRFVFNGRGASGGAWVRTMEGESSRLCRLNAFCYQHSCFSVFRDVQDAQTFAPLESKWQLSKFRNFKFRNFEISSTISSFCWYFTNFVKRLSCRNFQEIVNLSVKKLTVDTVVWRKQIIISIFEFSSGANVCKSRRSRTILENYY